MNTNDNASIKLLVNTQIVFSGNWSLHFLNEQLLLDNLKIIIQDLQDILSQSYHKQQNTNQCIITLDLNNIFALDSAGVYLINKLITVLSNKLNNDSFTNVRSNFINQQNIKNHVNTECQISYKMQLNSKYRLLYDKMTLNFKEFKAININISSNNKNKLYNRNLFICLIINTILHIETALQQIILMIIFLGNFFVSLWYFIRHPLQIKYIDVLKSVEEVGLNGLWVIALLCFLIGVTLAYELSPQFITYGANVYIVNFLGISLLKEVAPLLTAIIVAGRSGSAITATIGVMKIEEEIDAMQTMGISPMKRLIIPRVLGILIAMPLVTAVADIISLFGGAIVAKSYLSIPYNLFLSRLQTYVAISNYQAGLIKSVFFAVAIGLIACHCGQTVEYNANSIGKQTTKSVVWSIIAIVFLDALFAIIFKFLKM